MRPPFLITNSIYSINYNRIWGGKPPQPGYKNAADGLQAARRVAFLLYVNVVVDVLGTVAVIAVALGAVTKFLVGVVGVGLAADGALVDIALLLLGLLGAFLKLTVWREVWYLTRPKSWRKLSQKKIK